MAFNPPPTSPVERSLTIPPPVKGWNTRDPKSQMDPMCAVELENFFPNFGTVDLVKGYRYHSKSIGDSYVGGLGVLSYGSTKKLLAAGVDAGVNKLYDATTASSAGTALSVTLGNNPAGRYTYFQQFRDRIFITTNTTSDSMYYWTGTGNVEFAPYGGLFLDGYGAMAVYKSRLYVIQTATPNVQYSGVNEISGDMATFPCASLLNQGGNLAFIGSVTRAKDFSEDELFCIISKQGEVLVYQGDYPESATWSKIGHYQIPRPLGPKAFFYIGANLCIITSQGVIPMSDVLGGTATGRYLTLSDAITPSFTEAATTTLLDDYAWCGVNYTRGNFAVCNIPVTAGAVSNQFYMNSTTQAWCKRTNQNAFCWTLFNDELYFGGLNGKVFKADNGYFDEDPSNEGAVLTRTIKARFAFNYFGDPTTRKQFVAAIPTVYQSEGLDITANIDVDYTDITATSQETDTSKGTSYQIYQPRLSLVADSGNAGSFRIDGTVTTKRESIEAVKVIWNEGTIV